MWAKKSQIYKSNFFLPREQIKFITNCSQRIKQKVLLHNILSLVLSACFFLLFQMPFYKLMYLSSTNVLNGKVHECWMGKWNNESAAATRTRMKLSMSAIWSYCCYAMWRGICECECFNFPFDIMMFNLPFESCENRCENRCECGVVLQKLICTRALILWLFASFSSQFEELCASYLKRMLLLNKQQSIMLELFKHIFNA